MNSYIIIRIVFIAIKMKYTWASLCGCRTVRPCYQRMVDILLDKNEEACVEDASISSSTVEIYLKALENFCPDLITTVVKQGTYEARNFYKATLNIRGNDEKTENSKPVILIDAGQEADSESVGFALYIIEQLLACQENSEMLKKAKWVILPSTNPDGMIYGSTQHAWKKNLKPSEDGIAFGVDISRNFAYQFEACRATDSAFSPEYPGLHPFSEKESEFIKDTMQRCKKNIKLYISIRPNGHSLLYPYSYARKSISHNGNTKKIADNVMAKVNQKAGGIQEFMAESIFEANGKERCGHSVDYAFDQGIALAYELRVFIGEDNEVLTQFHQLPRGYQTTLRLGYFIGIKELYHSIVRNKSPNKLF